MDKQYAVSYISWFNNELETYFTRAASEEEALFWILTKKGLTFTEEELGDLEKVTDIKQFAFDCDCMIHAVEVP